MSPNTERATAATPGDYETVAIAGASRRSTLRRAALSAAFVVGLAACGGGSTDLVAADAPASAEVEVEDSDFLAAEAAPEALAFADPADEDTDGEGADDGVIVNPIGVDSPASPPDAPEAHAIFRDGELFLRDSVQTTEIAELIVSANEEAVGEGNVFNEYTIDPNSTFDPEASQAIFLANAALFESGSAEVAEDFEDVLAFILSLMEVQPDVTIWAFGHTDSSGDAGDNLQLSQDRVDAVRDRIIELDGDAERFFATGEGEENPIADNSTAEGRALNRRVEFILDGFDIGI